MINTQLKALLYLLEDPDPQVFENIKEELCSWGSKVNNLLHSKYENQELPDFLKERVQYISERINYDDATSKVSYWMNYHKNDFLEGLKSIIVYQSGVEVADRIIDQLIKMKREIWLSHAPKHSPLQSIRQLNDIFFNQFGFVIIDNNEDYSLLNIEDVLKYKMGEPVSIALLYLSLATQMNFPLHPVISANKKILISYLQHPFDPSHAHYTYRGESKFHIDTANYGKVISKNELQSYIHKELQSAGNELSNPYTHTELVHFFFMHLRQFYLLKQNTRKVEEIEALTSQIKTFKSAEKFMK